MPNHASHVIVGIDLGTTNSAIGIMTGEGPQLIPNALRRVLTPSVVGIDQDGQVLVGDSARELEVVAPERCAGGFKRYMGADWRCELAGRKFTATELSALVLRSLKHDAEVFLGHPVCDAVITVPAYFGELQRRATMEAGKMAELNVLRILNEPTAAAIAYGLNELENNWLAAVFDLGGGTFDISIVELFDKTIEVRASAGACFLGGDDFTRGLAAKVLESHGLMYERAEMESPKLVARVRQQCELAKRRLSDFPKVEIPMPNKDGSMGDHSKTCEVSREDFEKWTSQVLNEIKRPVRRAMADARVAPENLDRVILVGGATRMPCVVKLARELFGKSPRCELNPDEVVAIGAAVQAGRMARNSALQDLVVTDVAPFTLGIDVVKELGTVERDGYYLPIIHRNTTIPTSEVRRVVTLRANQDSILVEVFQGENRLVKDNLKLGELQVTGIPLGPRGQPIDVRFTYDLNGVLEVEACVVATGMKASVVISRHAGRLSQEDIDRAVKQMQNLKMHPRDDAENRFLLKRAERLFAELSGSERNRLEFGIDDFEQALESKDPELIEKHRDHLSRLMNAFDRDINQ